MKARIARKILQRLGTARAAKWKPDTIRRACLFQQARFELLKKIMQAAEKEHFTQRIGREIMRMRQEDTERRRKAVEWDHANSHTWSEKRDLDISVD
jgi:hypothetical protein